MSQRTRIDHATRQVLKVLREHYQPAHPDAKIEAYRYNSASIRLRIVDPAFADIRFDLRDVEVWRILKKHLSADILSQLSIILLLAPEEQADSMMNLEFDDPMPT